MAAPEDGDVRDGNGGLAGSSGVGWGGAASCVGSGGFGTSGAESDGAESDGFGTSGVESGGAASGGGGGAGGGGESGDVAEAGARRRGRRPGRVDTRAVLLSAARVEFSERGYDGATVRVIADRAGVDPAMVNHWFGGKEALFRAALEFPVDPELVVARVVPGDPEQMGERIVRHFLTVWDANGGGPMAAQIRSIASHESAARMMREFLGRMLIGRIVGPVAPDQPELRAALVGSQLIGMGMVRYVLKLEPLASADHATVVAMVAPTMQRYLTGPLP